MNKVSSRFKPLLLKKLQDNGYTNVHKFATAKGFTRSPIVKALHGNSKPTPDSLNKWCEALNCTAQERKEIFHAAGHLSPDEMDEEEAA